MDRQTDRPTLAELRTQLLKDSSEQGYIQYIKVVEDQDSPKKITWLMEKKLGKKINGKSIFTKINGT